MAKPIVAQWCGLPTQRAEPPARGQLTDYWVSEKAEWALCWPISGLAADDYARLRPPSSAFSE